MNISLAWGISYLVLYQYRALSVPLYRKKQTSEYLYWEFHILKYEAVKNRNSFLCLFLGFINLWFKINDFETLEWGNKALFLAQVFISPLIYYRLCFNCLEIWNKQQKCNSKYQMIKREISLPGIGKLWKRAPFYTQKLNNHCCGLIFEALLWYWLTFHGGGLKWNVFNLRKPSIESSLFHNKSRPI